jgi:hypothetical protein
MDGERSILEWDESDVHAWLSSLGYPQYEAQIREHKIRGDVLCMLDLETLKGVGVSTIGQRLAILKAVYLLKLAYDVPIGSDHYVPPSEAQERQEGFTMEKLGDIVRDQGQRLHHLEEENRRLSECLQLFMEDFNALRSSQGRPQEENGSLRRQPSFKWAHYVKPAKSPTKPEGIIESPHPSPQRLEHDLSYSNTPPQSQYSNVNLSPVIAPKEPRAIASTSNDSSPPSSSQAQPRPHRQESSDNLKSFKVSLDDPTWKVLPAALKKYRINNDNWQNYAMFICYGSTGNRIERCLSYDEKPLLLFQKLKDAKKNPVFMLKHIKDIRSPIAVAQQKHAARKAGSIISNSGEASSTTQTKPAVGASQGRTGNRPPKLEVHNLSAAPAAGANGWPEIMTPSTEVNSRSGELGMGTELGSTGAQAAHLSGSTLVGSTHDSTRARSTGDDAPARETPVASSGVSYAVAIYPYMAEQDDEFDVVVGDTFVILSRARGWWVVQRDPTGSGVVDTDTSKQGWVPAGCLLETSVPVASAIEQATAAKGSTASRNGSPPTTPVSKTPILPLSIISTSFPGIALMDYKKKGEEELDLIKDDALRVFKRYNHWSYAVKEEGGDRGWVPSWFIGKAASNSGAPATPNTAPSQLNSTLDADSGGSQVSPMSSAFPPVQTRTTTVN